MVKFLRILVPILVLLGLIFGGWLLLKDATIPVLNPSGEVSQAQRDLFVFTALLSLIVVVPVYVLLVFFAVKYRESNKKAKYKPNWAENRWLERLWWGIPIVLIAVLGVVTYQTVHILDPYKPLSNEDPVEVQVVALRWKWLFLYPEQGMATLNHLPIPVDRPVHFTLTADAPMSSFWIPALGSQIYTMNGMSSELNLRATKLGTFTGYNTNINGRGYSNMTFKTTVMPKSEYTDAVRQAAVSRNLMDRSMYRSLEEPEIVRDEITYRLVDTNLFQTITQKYMGHGSHSGTPEGQAR